MCHEAEAMISIPHYYGYNKDDRKKAFKYTDLYMDNKDLVFTDDYSKILKRK